jgi:rubrerythrin
MSIQFEGRELLEMALGIEINGTAFYQAMEDKTQNSDAKAIYNYLTVQERKHIDTFQGMLDSFGQYPLPETCTEEYILYLKSLIDNSVFSNATEARQRAASTSNEIEAVDTGIQAEKDSILLYTEMLDFVRQPDKNVVLAIINEEKAHLRQLSQVKQTLKKAK